MRYFSIGGRRRSLTEWAAIVGVTRQAMSLRISKVTSPEELELALTEPDFQGQSARDLAVRNRSKRIEDARIRKGLREAN